MAISSVQIPGYEILRPLGTGGMSTVYLALQRSLDRKVAIKVMRRGGDLASEESTQAEKRFLLEGRMMAKLPHRNIVAVYDIVSNDAMAYISMEFLDGGTLSDRMRDGISLADAVSVIVQIASALDFAHTHGVVHRDLKPANIMFRDSGTPVLTDFGIARYQDGSATRLTQTGMLVGTPTYMSPEQINGQSVDGRADLYSLGILFYELLAGHAPFRGDTPIAVLMAHLTQPAPTLPDEHAAFQPVLDRMLAKNRDERYAGMKEFSQDLKSRLIHSDTLLMRLNVDPNSPSSEQLRALGFASTPTGQGLRDSLLGSLPTPRPTPLPSMPGATQTTSAGKSKMPSAMTLTAVIGIVLVLIGAWLALHGRGGLSKDEQELVGLWLDRAEHRLQSNQLVAPADDSAFSYVQKIQQKDPDNARAQEILDQIAQRLAEQAKKSLAAGKFDEAADLNSEALLMHPEDADLRALGTQIAAAQNAEKSKKQILDLMQRADAARVAGKAFGENGAYSLLQKARQLSPNDPQVRKALDAVVAQQLEAPRQSLQAGNAAQAVDELARMQSYIGTEPAFEALRAQADEQRKKEANEKIVVTLLARGNQQLRAGRLAEPGGDNAFETLGEVSKAAGDDKRVGDFGTALAKALLAEAHRFDSIGQAPRALDRVGIALKAAPDLAEAQTLKSQIEQRLGERATKIAQTLGAARQAIADQRFVPPAKDDAYAALQSVLQQDPGNADAKQLLAELPKRISEAAKARALIDAGAASAMVEASRKVFAQDAELNALSVKFQAQLATEKSAAQAQATRDRIEKTLASSPTADQLRAAANELSGLLTADAANRENQALRNRFLDDLRDGLQSANGVVQFDARSAFAKDQAKLLGGERSFDELIASLPALREKVAEAEKARLDAERGELVLNAYPWGNVESVVDTNRQKIALPTDASTPLLLTLPAGSYVITFRHPKAAKPVQVIAKVEARKRASANAAFPTITAKEYFSRAGW